MRILIFLALLIFGLGVEIYAFRIVSTFGHMDWAEQYLGPGGSYSAWRLVGIIAIIGAFLVLRYGGSVLG